MLGFSLKGMSFRGTSFKGTSLKDTSSEAPRVGACARRETLGEDKLFALCARGFGVRFQCSLRPRPAAAGDLFRHGFVTLLGNGFVPVLLDSWTGLLGGLRQCSVELISLPLMVC